MRLKRAMLFSSELFCFFIKLSIFYFYCFPLIFYSFTTCDQTNIPIQTVANKFGVQMLSIGYQKSCFEEISENFQKYRSEVKQIDATKLMEEMRKDLVNMLNWKKDAVERIAIKKKEIAYTGYYNMKTLYDDRYNNKSTESDESTNSKALPLSAHPNFDDSLVNLDNSAVHVPINVYEKASDILNDIKWSEGLTETFKTNFANDPSLSWQFFGSSKGFIRIYPATTWRVPNDSYVQSKTQPPDLYDCRVRQWYIQAAASPKDIVILLDISGSMTGLRRHIAISVVYNILDTLNEDDFVIVLKFNNEVKVIHPCMNQMVQATKRNIKEIKENLDSIKTNDIANFTAAFITGFDTLKNFSRSDQGSLCNQAIMLITDGAPETYESVFKQHNPDSAIRVFTYVIGREVTQIIEVYWMACNNRGYYAQVANLAEVREQVQQYIPVMSRPLVLSESRIFTWTPVYTSITEIQLNDWIWNERVKALKTKILQQNRVFIDEPVVEIDENNEEEKKEKENDDEKGYYEATPDEDIGSIKKLYNLELDMAKKPSRKRKSQLMTTISTPVFDQRKFINVTKKILHKNVYLDSAPEPIRIANLLGIAGVDVPIREIEKMAPQFKVGVNGYSFMLTNNGKMLYHPDFRPIFQDMLKPFYSSVDFLEVELGNLTHNIPRLFDSDIERIRSELINGSRGSKKIISKSFFDQMRRPTSRKQHYVYGKVDNTPFSFGIVLPEQYGSYRFGAQVDLKNKPKSENYTRYFSGTHWRIHPDWVYCENPHKISGLMSSTPEDALVQFLSNDLMKDNFHWRTSSETPPRHENFTCDKDLLQSLIFDAINTHLFNQCSDFSRKFNRRDDKTIEIVNSFVSTRSGLTRFTNPYFSYEFKNRSEIEYNNLARSIDEVFYRRAVDYYNEDSKAFIYSVPFDASLKNEFTVTSSHAIFVGNGKMSTPVAVVGVQYNYSSFYSTFMKTAEMYKLNCETDQQDCFVLDNNAFVIISSSFYKHAGNFFGEINHELLQDMVRVGIYRKTHYYDYQAICIDIINTSSSSMFLETPLNYLRKIFVWFLSRLTTFYLNLFYESWLVSLEDPGDIEYEGEISESKSNKSRPKTCDKEVDLYELNKSNQTLRHTQTCDDCSRDYYVQHIPHSNLIILTLTKNCNCPSSGVKIDPKQIVYNNTEMCTFFKSENFRKRPDSCFNYHIKESEVKYCGGSAKLETQLIMYLVLFGLIWSKVRLVV